MANRPNLFHMISIISDAFLTEYVKVEELYQQTMQHKRIFSFPEEHNKNVINQRQLLRSRILHIGFFSNLSFVLLFAGNCYKKGLGSTYW